MSELTDTERALITAKSPGDDDTAGWEYALLHRTVETILTDRLAAVTARAEAAEAKVARIEAVIEPAWRTNLGHTCDTTTEAYAAGRNGLLDDLRAALADEGDTDE